MVCPEQKGQEASIPGSGVHNFGFKHMLEPPVSSLQDPNMAFVQHKERRDRAWVWKAFNIIIIITCLSKPQ